MDEIFGEENFIANITVISNFKGRSDDKYIASAHEYLLIYQNGEFKTNGVPIPEEYIEEYNLEEGNNKYRLQGLRKRGNSSKREDRPAMFYPFYFNVQTGELGLERTDENDIEILPKLSDGTDGRWRWGKKTSKENLHLLTSKLVSGREEYDVFQKDYLYDELGNIKSVKPKSFWMGSEFASETGTLEFKKEFKFSAFETPKPKHLIKYCLYQAITETESIVMDFFAGSGTTAIAVDEFNRETQKEVSFIAIQIPQLIESTHVASKKGFKKISDISKGRLNINSVPHKVYKLDKSNIYKWQDFDPEIDGGIMELSTQLELAYKNPIEDNTTPEEFITEILLQEGFPITSKKEFVAGSIAKITAKDVPYKLFISWTENLSQSQISSLGIERGDHFVCLDKAFGQDNSLKQMLDDKCKLYTI